MKKAQVTIYVIIGLVILLLVGTLYYSNYRIKTRKLTEEAPVTEFSQQAVTEIMNDCLKDLVLEAVDEHGICNTENMFKEKMMQKLPTCIDLSRFENIDYEVSAKPKPDKVEVTITEDEVFVNVQYPIVLSKNGIKYEFDVLEYSLPRHKVLALELDDNFRTVKDQILVTPDLDLELSIPKGTKVTSNNQPVQEIIVYIKEICPDDPAVLGQVKYDFDKEYEFEPEVFLTIRYEDQHVSRLAAEQQFKLAYLNENYWQNIESTGNIEKNKVRASVSHLSEWIATCDGANKYGLQLTSEDELIETPDQGIQLTEKELQCADDFSGPCGYAKLIVYTREDGFLETYTEAINKIYAQHLIPVLVLKENMPGARRTLDGIVFTKHPGMCEAKLDCLYGEDEDGSDKPGYDYDTLYKFIGLLNNVHADKPQWPMYVEVWEEPNLAIQWGDISLTDYQVQQYKNYYKQVATAIKELDHSESIRVMPAGLAPTEGMKRCMLTPEFDKIYDSRPETDEMSETQDGSAYMMHGDCQKIGFIIEGKDNLCTPDIPLSIEYRDCDVEARDCATDDYPDCYSQEDYDTCCDSQKRDIVSAKKWRDMYIGVGMTYLFDSDLFDPPEECTENAIELANNIYERTADTVTEYCWEKITEIPTNEYLGKLYSQDVCELADFYADHSYPAADSLDSYPGGGDPFGMEAYKARFDSVRSRCAGIAAQECYLPDEGDKDSDGIKDIQDNCPDNSNPGQEDWDKDGLGDMCDHSDGDDVPDSEDLCPTDEEIQTGTDTDGDGWADECDNCPDISNRDQKDLNQNNKGDWCEENIDSDGIPETAEGIEFPLKCVYNDKQDIRINCYDNCPYTPNGPNFGSCLNNQEVTCNSNLECGVGNSCHMKQEDEDGDGFGDVCDNCVNQPNPDQEDWNSDGEGDVCDDTDGDGFKDNVDFCKTVYSEENTPDVCKSEALCIGKAFITTTAWAPHPDIYPFWAYEHGPFNVDDYVAEMETAYNNWISDSNVIGVIPYHMGDEQVVVDRLADYSWTELCDSGDNACKGTNMYNTIGQVETPVSVCSGGFPSGGDCTNHKFLYSNLKAIAGPKTHLYSCMQCNSAGTLDPVGGSETTTNIPGGLFVKFQGMDSCFEIKDLQIPTGPGGCPEIAGSDTLDGYIKYELTKDGTTYYGIAVCKPDEALQSDAAWFHSCGTAEQCDYNMDNCIECGGTNGDYWCTCKNIEI